jgi:holin-like protein
VSEEGNVTVLASLALILVLIILGDAVTAGMAFPVPGSLLCLIAAGAFFASRGGPTQAMSRMFDGLIPYAPMLFVPAGAGVVTNLELIATGWLPIAAALTVGTAGALIATGAAAQILLQRLRPAEGVE